MRKKEKLFVVLLLSLLFILAFGTVVLRLTHRDIVIQQNLNSLDITARVESQDGSDVEPYLNEMEKIPLPIKQAFISRKWKLVIGRDERIDEIDRKNPHLSNCTGYTSYNERLIRLISPISVTHEMGHFLEYTLEFPNKCKELYEKEAVRATPLLGSYATENANEYFACYFAFWVTGEKREELKAVSPKTFMFFSQLEAQNWGQNTAKLIFPKNYIVLPRDDVQHILFSFLQIEQET